MPDINNYTVSPKELVELIIKSANIREGRWFLMANLGFVPGNFGSGGQMSPGATVVFQSMGIQRVTPELVVPPEMMDVVVDAAKSLQRAF